MEPTVEPGGLRVLLQYAKDQNLNVLDWSEDSPPLPALEPPASSERVLSSLPIDLIARGAELTGDPAFGLRCSNTADLSQLGYIYLIWRYSDCINLALRKTQRFLHVVNSALTVHIEPSAEDIELIFTIVQVSKSSTRYFADALLAVMTRLIRMRMGEDWAPLGVSFAYAAPEAPDPYKRFFRAPLAFESSHYALTLRYNDILTRFQDSDHGILNVVEKQLLQMEAALPKDFVSRVEQLVSAHLGRERLTVPYLAERLFMSPRTFQRKLATHGTSLSAVIAKVRTDKVRAYYGQEGTPNLATLAILLGYSEASAACRFITQTLGSRPTREH